MSDTPTDTNRDSTAAERADHRNTLNTDTMQWLSALVAIIGLYVVASPFIFEATDQAIWNDTLVGTGIFLLAGYNFVRLSRDRLASVGVASLAVLLGLWLLVSPAVIEMGSSTLATGTAASGLAIAVLSAYNAYANNKADAPDRVGARA
ncbi:SPW repeat protein [Haloterrigena sp. SYSU A558-1]|uniref:SPW repeat protein n=1 Tax=Haloterrigena gelatinilytica TaxID=2741724 RepID=A0A8J8KHN4_9EURY|nr:SPW repeat protein [Haloterrigena gelatinilytica]NUB91349.1 SPW repeat protein [Haloterrigena gelatinilytica]NUC72912.1 SPW repeat protein [Haloterrigena gelatinilytica]